MDAAKKADKALGVSPQTTSHTVTDAGSDVMNMVKYLRESNVSNFIEDRLTPEVVDPTDEGLKKLCSGWLKECLSRTHATYNSPPR